MGLFSSKTKTPKIGNVMPLAQQLTDAETTANKAAWETGVTANRSNQVGTEGSLNWSKDPTTGQWTQTSALNAPHQAQYDTLLGKAGEAASGFDASQIDLGGAPVMPEVGGYNQQAMDTIRALQAPQLERRRKAAEAAAAAKGIMDTGGSAYGGVQENLNTGENQADMEAIMGGLQQGNIEFGQGMQRHTVGTGDILNERAGNLGMLSGLEGMRSSMGKGPQMADTGGSVGTYNPGSLGENYDRAYGSELNRTNAKNMDSSNKRSMWGTAATVAATVF